MEGVTVGKKASDLYFPLGASSVGNAFPWSGDPFELGNAFSCVPKKTRGGRTKVGKVAPRDPGEGGQAREGEGSAGSRSGSRPSKPNAQLPEHSLPFYHELRCGLHHISRNQTRDKSDAMNHDGESDQQSSGPRKVRPLFTVIAQSLWQKGKAGD